VSAVRILVAVKQAAALGDEWTFTAEGTVAPDALQFELNDWDRFSVEEALRLREQAGGEVVVVTVGAARADDALRDCLAMGADRALRVWDETLCGGDPLTLARVLAAVAQRESPDLILCGAQSSDAVNGATGVALAGLLELPHAAVVKRIQCDVVAGTATVDRELENGLVEQLTLPLPALLTIQTGINSPRHANLRAIKRAREKPLELLGLQQLELDGPAVARAAGARRLSLAPPPRTGRAQALGDSPAAIAARIAELVRERIGG
jgi:electron transfer flavoprotein beta subunit